MGELAGDEVPLLGGGAVGFPELDVGAVGGAGVVDVDDEAAIAV